ncbi:MAG TPA: copper chaperone PCu(A)C [Thermoanaerobaculia bacterium]|nr:copper chaperone PCu(A)C [Thermoanaerobaculia bacterium]
MRSWCLIFLLLLAACGPGAEPPDGHELYLAYGCAACHGNNGDGNGPAASLAHFQPRDLRYIDAFSGPKTAEGIASTIAFGIADGRTGMPAYPDIPKRERLAMADYILRLKPPPRELVIERARAGESNPAWNIAAAYFEVMNGTDAPMAIIGVSSPVARAVEMHETTIAGGMMSMREVERIVLEPHRRTRLQPGGSHLMLIDVNRPLRTGDSVDLTLTFHDKSTRTVTARVEPVSTAARPVAPAAAVVASTSDLTLVDDQNRPFSFTSLRGKPALLFFGYTHCPDACPTTMSTIARAYREAKTDLPTLFVSVDPRDTPAVLDQYLDYFTAVPAKGLTGSKEQLDAVVKRFGARYELREGGLVDHTLNIYLLDRNGNVARTFAAGGDAGELAKAIKAQR